jgi:hypothetical protein
MRKTFFGCCASTITANATSATAISNDNAATFFIAHLVLAAFLSRILKLRKVFFTAEGEPDSPSGKG